MYKNKGGLILGLATALGCLLDLVIPLYTSTYFEGYQLVDEAYSAFVIMGCDWSGTAYEFAPGLIGFLAVVLVLDLILIVVASFISFNDGRGKKPLAIVSTVIAIFISFVFMVVGFIGANNFDNGIAYGEIGFIEIVGSGITFIVLSSKESYHAPKKVSYNRSSPSQGVDGWNLNSSANRTTTSAQTTSTNNSNSSQSSQTDQIAMLTNLYQTGVITKAEYDKKVREILGLK